MLHLAPGTYVNGSVGKRLLGYGVLLQTPPGTDRECIFLEAMYSLRSYKAVFQLESSFLMEADD